MIKRKRALPISVFVVSLLVVLAGIGIVSGLWSKNLVVEGTVETGDLRVDWTSASGSDDLCTDFNPLAPECDFVEKEVGEFDCWVDKEDAQILHFEASNTYPSYEADCQYHFTNTGSIPWIVRGAEIIPGTGLTDCVDDSSPPQTVVLDCKQLKIGYFDNVGVQVDPGNQVAGSIKIHVEQEAEQSDCTAQSANPFGTVIVGNIQCDADTLVSYNFDIFVCVAQWNEAATYDECKTSPQHEGPIVDRIIDADGFASAGDGLGSCGLPATPGSRDVTVGDLLTSWPTSLGFGPTGIDWFDKGSPGNGVFDVGCNGDDLHAEGAGCPGADRDGEHDLGVDCQILDHNGDLADHEGVECDLETGTLNPNGFSTDGVACPPTNNLAFHDANGSGAYDDGEDIVLDANNDGIFN